MQVLKHELAHLMGFGHDGSDVMNPQFRFGSSFVLTLKKVLDFMKARKI